MIPDLSLSPVIAGTMKWGAWGRQFSTRQYQEMIEACLGMGVTSFDHADIYGGYTTEAEFGQALKALPGLRNQIQLISKCGIRMLAPNRPLHQIKSYDTSKAHIIASAEQSLKNLNTDYLDVFLIHRPDPLMDPDEIAGAFHQLREQGKVLHFGVSNFTPSQVQLLHSRFPVVTNQVEISILRLSPFLDGTLDQCQTLNLLPMAWSPLGGGNIFAHLEEDRIKRVVAMADILAARYHCMPDQVLLAWLLKHPSGIKPVLGTSKPERVKAALGALSVKLSREEWFTLWRASTGQEVP